MLTTTKEQSRREAEAFTGETINLVFGAEVSGYRQLEAILAAWHRVHRNHASFVVLTLPECELNVYEHYSPPHVEVARSEDRLTVARVLGQTEVPGVGRVDVFEVEGESL